MGADRFVPRGDSQGVVSPSQADKLRRGELHGLGDEALADGLDILGDEMPDVEQPLANRPSAVGRQSTACFAWRMGCSLGSGSSG